MTELRDQLARPLRDLRISVIDRCNLRCTYCMPEAMFGPDHAFLPRGEWLTADEIWRLTGLMAKFRLRKIRWTGGEPLLRPDLTGLAAALAEAGLDRVTVSLDALNPDIYARMAGGRGGVGRVLEGIVAARAKDEALRETIRGSRQRRSDRYSERRRQTLPRVKAEMSYLGG